MGKGIAVAGNMIVDVAYPIERYPGESELTTITGGAKRTVGGLVCNVIIDLAKLDGEIPLQAIGLVGTDPEGELMLEKLSAFDNVNVAQVTQTGRSSVSIVMNSNEKKTRTFFQDHGNNAYFDESFIDWENVNADVLHVGYILLLDALDEEDSKYGTKMARLLAHAHEHGLKTSIDVVTETGDRFKKLVIPAIRYSDYCIINESEAQQVTGITLRTDDGTLVKENIPKALKTMKEFGVSEWAVIHCPEGGYGLDRDENYVECKSLSLPDDYIKGSVGAGDAFCSGVLYGAEKGWSLLDSLKLAVCTAAASLSEFGASDGVRSVEDVLALYDKFTN